MAERENLIDPLEFLKYQFEENEIPYILVYRPFEDGTGWCIQRYGDTLDIATGIAGIISDMAENDDIGIDDIIAAISELTKENEKKKKKKSIKEIQKKICPLCSMNYGEDEDYCGYGDTCELIKRIRDGKVD